MSPSSATAARRSPSPWITGSRRTGPSRSPSSIPCTCSPWRTRPRLTRPSSGSSSPRARQTPRWRRTSPRAGACWTISTTRSCCSFADMAEHLNEEGDEYKFSYTIAPGKQGEYSLYYTNCVPNTAVSFNLEVELYNSKNSQPGSVQQIHLLMGVLVFFKCLTVLCQSGMYHLIRLKGDPEGWNVAFYIFYSIRGLLLFTVVVLIG